MSGVLQRGQKRSSRRVSTKRFELSRSKTRCPERRTIVSAAAAGLVRGRAAPPGQRRVSWSLRCPPRPSACLSRKVHSVRVNVHPQERLFLSLLERACLVRVSDHAPQSESTAPRPGSSAFSSPSPKTWTHFPTPRTTEYLLW